MKTVLILTAMCQAPIPTEEDFWSGRHVESVLQGKYLRNDGQHRTNTEQEQHNGVSMNRKPGGVRNAEDLMRKLMKVDPKELKQPKKKPLRRKPKK